MTVRDALKAFDGYENIVDEYGVLDAEISNVTWLAAEKTGALQVHAGGDAIVAFRRADRGYGILLVVDETPSYGWKSVEANGPKPANRLRLVQTA